jgi:hypothetical protein
MLGPDQRRHFARFHLERPQQRGMLSKRIEPGTRTVLRDWEIFSIPSMIRPLAGMCFRILCGTAFATTQPRGRL